MGVTQLWQVLAPVERHQSLASLEGLTLAVDLSIWVCETQSVKQMQGVVSKPFLRNLFFRISHLTQLGVKLVFVIEGTAPALKWEVMMQRQQTRYPGRQPKQPSQKPISKQTRRNFNACLKECCELLEILGIPYVQSQGEAEAMCALLNATGIVDGCLTNDGDAFLYGARTVYRNFTMNAKDPHVETYTMAEVEAQLEMDRHGLVALGLLLGCDFVPKGVPGIGVANATKLLQSLRGMDVLERLQKWRKMPESQCVNQAEILARRKALSIPDFPQMKVIQEFMSPKDHCPTSISPWRRPALAKFQEFALIKMDWPIEYSLEKVLPLISLWDMQDVLNSSNPSTHQHLKPARIVKTRVRQGVPCYEVEWHKPVTDGSWEGDFYVTIEPQDLFSQCYPHLVNILEFETAEGNKKKKKNQGKRKKKNAEKAANNINDALDNLSFNFDKMNVGAVTEKLKLSVKGLPPSMPVTFDMQCNLMTKVKPQKHFSAGHAIAPGNTSYVDEYDTPEVQQIIANSNIVVNSNSVANSNQVAIGNTIANSNKFNLGNLLSPMNPAALVKALQSNQSVNSGNELEEENILPFLERVKLRMKAKSQSADSSETPVTPAANVKNSNSGQHNNQSSKKKRKKIKTDTKSVNNEANSQNTPNRANKKDNPASNVSKDTNNQSIPNSVKKKENSAKKASNDTVNQTIPNNAKRKGNPAKDVGKGASYEDTPNSAKKRDNMTTPNTNKQFKKSGRNTPDLGDMNSLLDDIENLSLLQDTARRQHTNQSKQDSRSTPSTKTKSRFSDMSELDMLKHMASLSSMTPKTNIASPITPFGAGLKSFKGEHYRKMSSPSCEDVCSPMSYMQKHSQELTESFEIRNSPVNLEKSTLSKKQLKKARKAARLAEERNNNSQTPVSKTSSTKLTHEKSVVSTVKPSPQVKNATAGLSDIDSSVLNEFGDFKVQSSLLNSLCASLVQAITPRGISKEEYDNLCAALNKIDGKPEDSNSAKEWLDSEINKTFNQMNIPKVKPTTETTNTNLIAANLNLNNLTQAAQGQYSSPLANITEEEWKNLSKSARKKLRKKERLKNPNYTDPQNAAKSATFNTPISHPSLMFVPQHKTLTSTKTNVSSDYFKNCVKQAVTSIPNILPTQGVGNMLGTTSFTDQHITSPNKLDINTERISNDIAIDTENTDEKVKKKKKKKKKVKKAKPNMNLSADDSFGGDLQNMICSNYLKKAIENLKMTASQKMRIEKASPVMDLSADDTILELDDLSCQLSGSQSTMNLKTKLQIARKRSSLEKAINDDVFLSGQSTVQEQSHEYVKEQEIEKQQPVLSLNKIIEKEMKTDVGADSEKNWVSESDHKITKCANMQDEGGDEKQTDIAVESCETKDTLVSQLSTSTSASETEQKITKHANNQPDSEVECLQIREEMIEHSLEDNASGIQKVSVTENMNKDTDLSYPGIEKIASDEKESIESEGIIRSVILEGKADSNYAFDEVNGNGLNDSDENLVCTCNCGTDVEFEEKLVGRREEMVLDKRSEENKRDTLKTIAHVNGDSEVLIENNDIILISDDDDENSNNDDDDNGDVVNGSGEIIAPIQNDIKETNKGDYVSLPDTIRTSDSSTPMSGRLKLRSARLVKGNPSSSNETNNVLSDQCNKIVSAGQHLLPICSEPELQIQENLIDNDIDANNTGKSITNTENMEKHIDSQEDQFKNPCGANSINRSMTSIEHMNNLNGDQGDEIEEHTIVNSTSKFVACTEQVNGHDNGCQNFIKVSDKDSENGDNIVDLINDINITNSAFEGTEKMNGHFYDHNSMNSVDADHFESKDTIIDQLTDVNNTNSIIDCTEEMNGHIGDQNLIKKADLVKEVERPSVDQVNGNETDTIINVNNAMTDRVIMNGHSANQYVVSCEILDQSDASRDVSIGNGFSSDSSMEAVNWHTNNHNDLNGVSCEMVNDSEDKFRKQMISVDDDVEGDPMIDTETIVNSHAERKCSSKCANLDHKDVYSKTCL